MKGPRDLIRSLIVILLGCSLFACNYPETSSSTEKSSVCSPESLHPPEPVSPSMLEVIPDLSPDFHWVYPAGCDPDKFNLEVIFHPLMGIHEPVLTVEVEGYKRSWSSEKFLSEGKHYAWRISATSGAESSSSSDYAFFFTGPICKESSLIAPELVLPRQNMLVHQTQPWLQWRYPESCLPDTFYVVLVESPSFAGDNLAAEVILPTWIRTVKAPLSDCTQYFWRVAAKVGEQLGPFSSTGQFWTDFTEACNFAPVHPGE